MKCYVDNVDNSVDNFCDVKKFLKNFKKVIDKVQKVWYNNKWSREDYKYKKKGGIWIWEKLHIQN